MLYEINNVCVSIYCSTLSFYHVMYLYTDRFLANDNAYCILLARGYVYRYNNCILIVQIYNIIIRETKTKKHKYTYVVVVSRVWQIYFGHWFFLSPFCPECKMYIFAVWFVCTECSCVIGTPPPYINHNNIKMNRRLASLQTVCT